MSSTKDPCISICKFSDDICVGCGRSKREIRAWKKLDKVDKPLKNVVDGASTTTIPDVTIAELAKVPHAINVHHSTTDVATYVACGNLPQAK